MAEIGEPTRRIIVEPIEEPAAPAVPAPAPAAPAEPAREPVPA